MAAFFSNTRNHCTYIRIKDFNEDWKTITKQINSLKPQGYTRMGPAIRHATHLLSEVKARKKILLIISDSKPTDYDAYEGAHGEADVHHAILEARCKQITVKGLAVMEKRAGHVKRIYGKSGFEQFTDAHGLSERIVRTYREALNKA
jgi:nitric oxide reductase NorD protein